MIDVPNKLIPFDWDTYYQFQGTIKVGMTDVLTGEIVYKNGKELDKECTMLRDTCAIPIVFPAVTIDERVYYDGGLSDAIPIRQSLHDGNQKNLVLLTQPKDFVKKLSKKDIASIRILNKRYPKLAQTIRNRPKMYNDTLTYLKNLKNEEPSNTIILQPEYKLNSGEADIGVLEKTYQHGYEVAVKNMDYIKKLFN